MENYESIEEKDAMEYMKSHGVRNISVIGEKTMSPLALIKWMIQKNLLDFQMKKYKT